MAEMDQYRVLGTSGRSLRLLGHVGFDSLPDQLVNKSIDRGFSFNILCVGETGIGKSTLMDALFKSYFKSEPHTHDSDHVHLVQNTYSLTESSVNLRLTIVETVGFGDQINKEDSISSVISYLDAQYEAYLQEEMKIKRVLSSFHDTRVHVCLYFLPPTGHSLKSLDLVCMKMLDRKVNIVPIIAKADAITKSELVMFKQKIMQELAANGVSIYRFPVDDTSVADLNALMNDQMPFAVVGSGKEKTINNEKYRVREYPWGSVVVENDNHCDFVKLREMLLRTNMEDLIETTHTKHYELYRRTKLEEKGFQAPQDDSFSLRETYRLRREEYLRVLVQKEEKIRQTFLQKIKDKENELKSTEQELQVRFEEVRRKQAEDKKVLDERTQQLEEDMKALQIKKQEYNQLAEQSKKSNKKVK